MQDKGKGRSEGQKLKLYYMIQYLLENADEKHAVTPQDIIDHLATHGIKVERKTVYSDIQLLSDEEILDLGATDRKTDYDFDVKFKHTKPLIYDKKYKGYRIHSRDFELYELQLLIDSVQSSKFVPLKTAQNITDKLKQLTSRHNRYILDRQTYVVNRIRSEKQSVFYGVNPIHSAIHNNNKISFRYFTYNLKKEKEYFKKEYIVSPYALLWNDDKYYLLAFDGNQMKHFRVDKMDSVVERTEKNVKELKEDDKREGQAEFKALKLSERQSKVFSMFGGVEERVRLRFTNNLIGVALDRFGKDIPITTCDNSHFETSVKIEVSPIFFGWLCGFGKQVKVLSPDHIEREFAEYVSSIAKMYEDVTEK